MQQVWQLFRQGRIFPSQWIFGKQNPGAIYSLSTNYTVNPVCSFIEIIIAQLEVHIQENQETSRHPYCQTDYVDQEKKPMSLEVSKRSFKITSNHMNGFSD